MRFILVFPERFIDWIIRVLQRGTFDWQERRKLRKKD